MSTHEDIQDADDTAWVTSIDIAQPLTATREAKDAYHTAQIQEEKDRLKQYYIEHRDTILASMRERRRIARESDSTDGASNSDQHTRKDRRDILNTIHPFDHSAEYTAEVDAINNSEMFTLRSNAPTLPDIIETRTDLAELDREAALHKPLSYQQKVESVFRKAWAREATTLNDTEPQRIAVCWRIIREWARLRGDMGADQTLEEGLGSSSTCKDPWTIPQPYHKTSGLSPKASMVFSDINEYAEELSEEYRHTTFNEDTGDFEIRFGFGYLPPPVPLKWQILTEDGPQIAPGYNPRDDKLLGLYCRILAQLCDELFIGDGSPADREYGVMGMAGLFRPDTVRLAFPSRNQIMTYESLMIQKTGNWLVFNSSPECGKSLKQEFGLLQHEINRLIRVSRIALKKQTESDIEDDKSLMLLRLEDYLHRSKQALDLNSEMKGLKQISIIQGLAKLQSDDEMSDFVDVVRAFNKDHKQPALHEDIQLGENNVRVLGSGD